jgi:protein-S-isoprenylcysteine O-methyltransferase Ste14
MTNRPSKDLLPAEIPTNYRAMKRRTERNLIVGGFVILVVVGGGLVGVLYGFDAMLQSWLCMGGAVALLGGMWLIFKVIEKFINLTDEK